MLLSWLFAPLAGLPLATGAPQAALSWAPSWLSGRPSPQHEAAPRSLGAEGSRWSSSHLVPENCGAYPNLTFTKLLHNNLGGRGPDSGKEGLLLLVYNEQIQRYLHLEINAGSTYFAEHETQNGLSSVCGTVNIRTGTQVTLRFVFRDAAYGNPVTMPQVAFTFYDLDQCKEHHCVEFITVHNVSAYQLSAETEIVAVRPNSGERFPSATFYSTTRGDWFDNPGRGSLSHEMMSEKHHSRAVSVAFLHTTEISVVFGASEGNGARYLEFIGCPGLFCTERATTWVESPATARLIGVRAPEDQQEPEDSQGVSTQGGPVPPSPSRMPFTAYWVPQEGNLSGTITVDYVDWDRLRERPAVIHALKEALKRVIAVAAGRDVAPEHVHMTLGPGIINVRAKVHLAHAQQHVGGDDGRVASAQDGIRKRLADSEILELALTTEVRSVADLRKVAAGPPRMTGWHLLPGQTVNAGHDKAAALREAAGFAGKSQAEAHVTGLGFLANVDYSQLSDNEALRDTLKSAMARAIAGTAGGGLQEKDIDVELRVGSVVATATVTPPHGLSAHVTKPSQEVVAGTGMPSQASADGSEPTGKVAALRARLKNSDRLCRNVDDKVHILEDISQVATGTIAAKDWHLRAATAKDAAHGRLVLDCADYDLLQARPGLLQRVQEAVGAAVASEAGGDVAVDVSLRPGPTILRVTPSATGGAPTPSANAGASVEGPSSGSDGVGRLRSTTTAAHEPQSGLGAEVCDAVREKVMQLPGIWAVKRAAPAGAGAFFHSWHPVAGSKSSEDVICVAEDLDYSRLLSAPALIAAVEKTLRSAVAARTGGSASPEDMSVSMRGDSISADVTVKPEAKHTQPQESQALRERLGCAEKLSWRAAQEVNNIHGVHEVAVGAAGDGGWYRPAPAMPQEAGEEGDYLTTLSTWPRVWITALMVFLILACMSIPCCSKHRKREWYNCLSRAEAPKRSREFYAPLHSGDWEPDTARSSSSLTGRSSLETTPVRGELATPRGDPQARGTEPVEVEFRNHQNESTLLRFKYRDHGLRLTRDMPVKVSSFAVNSYARDHGVQVGWSVARVDNSKVGRSETSEAVERLLSTNLAHLPPAPLRLDFDNNNGERRTLHIHKQPLGVVFTRNPPFKVDVHKPDSHAKERGVEVGWTLRQVGGVVLSGSTTREMVNAYLTEGLQHLPQDPSGLRMKVEFRDPDGATRVIFFQRRPLGLILRDERMTNATRHGSRQSSVVVEGFAFNSYAKERGVGLNWAVMRVAEQQVSPNLNVTEVAQLLDAESAMLPLWPLRMDFGLGEPIAPSTENYGGRVLHESRYEDTKTFYFEYQPLGVEFTKVAPIRVDHFKMDSYAQRAGVKESWAVARIGDVTLSRNTDYKQMMHYMQGGLDHLPQEEKGVRMDFIDPTGNRRICYFQRQPLGLTFSRQRPPRVESFLANSYAVERGVEVGWMVAQLGDEEVSQNTTPEQLQEMMQAQSRTLPVWPLRVELGVTGGTIRTFYFEMRPDFTISSSSPWKVDDFPSGGIAETKGVQRGWTVKRVGHLVVTHNSRRDDILRCLQDGSAHLPDGR